VKKTAAVFFDNIEKLRKRIIRNRERCEINKIKDIDNIFKTLVKRSRSLKIWGRTGFDSKEMIK